MRFPCLHRIWILLLGLASASAATPSSDKVIPPRPALPEIQSLKLLPASLTLTDARDARRVLVMGQRPDGGTIDLTSEATFQTSSTNLVVGPDQFLSGLQAGEFQVTVSAAGQSVKLPVQVTSVASRPVGFVRDIEPVLSRASCNQGTCHGSAKGKNGFKLSLRGYDPDYDYQALINDLSGRRFNTLGTLVLTGAAVGPRLLPPPLPPPPAFEAQFTEPDPAAEPPPVNLADGFRWDAIESTDYRQFIANLRASEAPEQLIRDVVALELLRTFAPRYRDAMDPVPPRAYWQKTTYRPPSAGQQKRLADLSAEMGAILHGLFGLDISAEEAFNLLFAQPNWLRVELAWLPAETAAHAFVALEPILRQEQAEQQPEETGPDQERRLQRRLEALESILTPAQLQEYRHRNSEAHRTLKAQLRLWDPSEQEFQKLANLNDHTLFRPTTRLEDFQEREAKAQKVFGPKRAASFIRATDLSYIYAVTYVRQTGLPPNVADQVWQIKRSTLAEDQRLRVQSQLAPEPLQQERAVLVRRTEETITAILGPDGLRYLKQDWPWWQALAKP